MFSLICVWINGWVNNRKAGDLRRHRGHYDVNVMYFLLQNTTFSPTTDIVDPTWWWWGADVVMGRCRIWPFCVENNVKPDQLINIKMMRKINIITLGIKLSTENITQRHCLFVLVICGSLPTHSLVFLLQRSKCMDLFFVTATWTKLMDPWVANLWCVYKKSTRK